MNAAPRKPPGGACLPNELAARLPECMLLGSGDLPILDVTQDSRLVEPGSLFVARRGSSFDGRSFANKAKELGAVAILTDDGQWARESCPLPAIVATDLALATGIAARIVHGYPDRELDFIAITGTNGKSTSAHLLQGALGHLGVRAAAIGTLGASFEGTQAKGVFTTPQVDTLARLAREFRSQGAEALVLEASSHGLEQGRIEPFEFASVGFLNLTQDHLDFHGDMKSYELAKQGLFQRIAHRHATFNISNPVGARLAEAYAGQGLTVSLEGDPQVQADPVQADLVLSRTEQLPSGLRAECSYAGMKAQLISPLIGLHNLENLAVSLGMLLGLGHPLDAACAALGKVGSVPGRLEPCHAGGEAPRVFVDYAHTPDALERALAALRPTTEGRLLCVFGCGGDRDRAKRPLMAQAAAQGAEMLWVTNDNPRSEVPADIAAEIEAGLTNTSIPWRRELDREAAIFDAVAEAKPLDTVLIAGKGHEQTQTIGQTVLPFDDAQVARRALEQVR